MKRCFALVVVFLVVILTSSLNCHALVISPEMELLAGVLSQTTWMEHHGPSSLGNEYFQALQGFFAEYKGHKAVTLAQSFTNKGFTYDAPPAFICHLGPLPDLELVYEYSEYLVKRGGGRGKLEEFRLALADLAKEADFLTFFESWETYLEASLESSRQGFRRELLETWLAEFFGWSPAEFHLIMTPSMFPGGGYGPRVTDEKGDYIAFQIIRENGYSEERPEFPTGVNLESLTTHELGHSFVNPSLEAYPKRAQNLRPLLWPVRKTMKSQAYTTVSTFLNEQVIRAVEVVAARDLFTPEIEGIILANNENRGFYLTSFVVEQLEYYQSERERFPTFRDFVPYLYDKLDLYQKENSTWQERFLGRFLH